MKPKLSGIDHIHVYVKDLAQAESWYRRVLGLTRLPSLEKWAAGDGPLTLRDPGGSVHLALFERSDPEVASTIAFGAEGRDFLAWKTHLEDGGHTVKLSDHDLAFSIYFKDPDGNQHEITSYDTTLIRETLRSSGEI